MTDGIGRIFGGNNYGLGGYFPNRKDEESSVENNQTLQPDHKAAVNPNEVLDYLSATSAFNRPALSQVNSNIDVPKLDAETQARIAKSMDDFVFMYDIVSQEVGDKFALEVINKMIDKGVA